MGQPVLVPAVAAQEEERSPAWFNVIALLVAAAAGVTAFLPFAFDTSPWDAVTLRVPGNQGNWWHALVGAPFFLAFPILWLCLRSLFSRQLSTPAGRRLLWVTAGLSIVGTISVELPFLLHLAGTSKWERLSVLSLGFGIVIVSAVLLFLRRHNISLTRACIVALNTAYLASAALCLVVYSDAPGPLSSRSGWFLTMAIIWSLFLELVWIFAQSRERPNWRLVPESRTK
jgi:hypothetical protein